MMLRPASVDELAATLAGLTSGGAQGTTVDLSALHRVLEYRPEDMTVTVETGITLEALQSHLAQHGQWLPIDPPNPGSTTLAMVLAHNLSGPRRFGFGTIREHLLGLKVVLADGRVIRNGGKVVKNVAGYDLCKLFVGDRATLGVVVETTFKVLPRPEEEKFLVARCDSLLKAAALIESVLESDLTPVVLDLHHEPASAVFSVVLGCAGTRQDVAWQLTQAAPLGLTEAANLNYAAQFWSDPSAEPARISVLPSRLAESISQLGPVSFVARAGSGIIYYRGAPPLPKTERPLELMRRIKDAFDPKHILPGLSA